MSSRAIRLILAVVVVAVALVVVLPATSQDTGQQSEKCCFTNPQYAGVCQVTPGEGETCASILAYLNDQSSTGKSYCDNTTLRGGWAEVECEPGGETAPGS